ncbi:hypothetical protein [Mesorhizobium sp. YM1C-6-2]|jgi:hypothetical protein|uniref:hypothetical protein n=1 Tax=Mesorhizobium sp. YM1C-6-2 TaxID=1827501 RepID=UPI000EF259C5|nr:hypothetical protein [Mesorhizobium sp. YM1C-6-2]RLP22645.1 hypothetical protein D8676_23690 [Mesorhizobium sp. YM1C-6-2]
MGAATFNTDRVPTCDDIVSALLSGHPLGQPVSTRSVLADFRGTAPASLETDDAIVESVVRIATGRTMAVVFDHRVAPEASAMSWRSDAAV